jgi:hypothetical protein
MATEQTLPADWVLDSEDTTYDIVMDRDYSNVIYRQTDTGMRVYVHEINEAKTNAWKYMVHHSGADGELGSYDDLDTAKETALKFINDSE